MVPSTRRPKARKRWFREAAMRFMAVIPLSTKVEFGYIVDRKKELLQQNFVVDGLVPGRRSRVIV
jgi:hypothetical protein